MSKVVNQPKSLWVSPKLVKLGKLADVAPGAPGTTEGGSGKS